MIAAWRQAWRLWSEWRGRRRAEAEDLMVTIRDGWHCR